MGRRGYYGPEDASHHSNSRVSSTARLQHFKNSRTRALLSLERDWMHGQGFERWSELRSVLAYSTCGQTVNQYKDDLICFEPGGKDTDAFIMSHTGFFFLVLVSRKNRPSRTERL